MFVLLAEFGEGMLELFDLLFPLLCRIRFRLYLFFQQLYCSVSLSYSL
jgi:hypothetical protein